MVTWVYISSAGIGSSANKNQRLEMIILIKKWLKLPPAIHEKNQIKPLQAVPNAKFEGCSLLVPFVYEIIFVVIKLRKKTRSRREIDYLLTKKGSYSMNSCLFSF